MPALHHDFGAATEARAVGGARGAGLEHLAGGGGGPHEHHASATSRDTSLASQFVSSVAWAQHGNTLLAANSVGHVQVLALA